MKYQAGKNSYYRPGRGCCAHPHANMPIAAQVALGLPKVDATEQDLLDGAMLEVSQIRDKAERRSILAALRAEDAAKNKADRERIAKFRAEERAAGRHPKTWTTGAVYQRSGPHTLESRERMRKAQQARRAKERLEADV